MKFKFVVTQLLEKRLILIVQYKSSYLSKKYENILLINSCYIFNITQNIIQILFSNSCINFSISVSDNPSTHQLR